MILSGPHERLITNNNPQMPEGRPGSLLAQKIPARVAVQEPENRRSNGCKS
jgi:hypothetical protein